MSIITCDGCGKSLEIGYGYPNNIEFSFTIPAHNEPEKLYQFRAEAKLTYCFTTTNVHFCRDCIEKGLRKP